MELSVLASSVMYATVAVCLINMETYAMNRKPHSAICKMNKYVLDTNVAEVGKKFHKGDCSDVINTHKRMCDPTICWCENHGYDALWSMLIHLTGDVITWTCNAGYERLRHLDLPVEVPTLPNQEKFAKIKKESTMRKAACSEECTPYCTYTQSIGKALPDRFRNGVYTCSSLTNTDTSGDTIIITINSIPEILDTDKVYISKPNTPLKVKIRLLSNPDATDMEFKHYHLDMIITNSSNTRVMLTESWIRLSLNEFVVNIRGYIAELNILNVTEDMEGKYSLHVTNAVGTVVHVFDISVDRGSGSRKGEGFLSIAIMIACSSILLLTAVVFTVKNYKSAKVTKRSNVNSDIALTTASVQSTELQDTADNSDDRCSYLSLDAGEISPPPTYNSIQSNEVYKDNQNNRSIHPLGVDRLSPFENQGTSKPKGQKSRMKRKNISLPYLSLDTAEISPPTTYNRLQSKAQFNNKCNGDKIEACQSLDIAGMSSPGHNSLPSKVRYSQINLNNGQRYHSLNAAQMSPPRTYNTLQPVCDPRVQSEQKQHEEMQTSPFEHYDTIEPEDINQDKNRKDNKIICWR